MCNILYIIRSAFFGLAMFRKLLLRSKDTYCKWWFRQCNSDSTSRSLEHLLQKNILSCGQPTVYSHPHILQEGELLPGIHIQEFRSRRQQLMEDIWQSNSLEQTHIVIIPAATQCYMTERIPYPYRQNSDMLYLSGCMEPNCALVISSSILGRAREVLFVRGKDAHQELWDGPRIAANQSSAALFGVDEVLPCTELTGYLRSFARNKEKFTMYESSNPLPPPDSIKATIETFVTSIGPKIESPRSFLHKLRLIKSPAEVQLMMNAAQIASEAIASTIAVESGCDGIVLPWLEERQIAARVDYECRARGAQQLAYPPVVASGNRTNTIHYISNNQRAYPDDLILMDAGCEYYGYNSDITRTWPASGKFSSSQQALYEALLDVQTQLITLLTERPSLDELFVVMCQLLGLRLRDLGFVSASASRAEQTQAARKFCPHHVSHFLGMDVHDTCTIPHNIPLRPGMVLTIEPGIYINQTSNIAPVEFRGMGMRIEDDVLITDGEPIVLSSNCPKSVQDLEKLMISIPFS
ncbi:hypothetical protein B566_EDAN005154 [Ephemera danica]|nr:hypothetical protein B566_EDAN005154 [Ephemera danica]